MNNPSPRARALFIVLEGIDGSGSTTQGDRLTTWLRSEGYRTHFTHEPSGGPAGMMIRLALSRRLRGASGDVHVRAVGDTDPPSDLDPYTLALFYAADRMDHLANEVAPNLLSKKIVVCDRYLLSSLAYQGESVDEEWIFQTNRFAPAPHLCIYLDVPVEYAKDRMQRTRWTRDLYETEGKLRRVRERYLRLVADPRPELGKVITVDATKSVETVAKRIRLAIVDLLETPIRTNVVGNLNLFEWPK